jgi:predicted nucleotidyltransferase
MSILGIVVEYNPFHNGHLYHIEHSKKMCGADYVICVMSGSFIQRGEPALIDKWARAEAALLSGVDLVIELPVIYAMSSAEFFAFGAVKILDSLGIVDYICFGSESGSMEDLLSISEILNQEPQLYREYLKQALNYGLSFPSARESALNEYISSTRNSMKDNSINKINRLMNSSNNILGIEYLKAIKKLDSTIKPLTIKRTGNIYNESGITGNISSATAIRKHISNLHPPYDSPELSGTVPKSSLDILRREFENGKGPVYPWNFEKIILSKLRGMPVSDISKLPYVSEGLENRIAKACADSGSYAELFDRLSTKRYPGTRIQRILFAAATDLKASDLKRFNFYGGPRYARILGFNKNGRKLIKRAKVHATIPLVTKTSSFLHNCRPLSKKMLEIEQLATDIYVLGFSNPKQRKSGQDYTRNPVII